MGNYIQSVSINDLRPGMFVSDVFNDKGILLFSSNTFLTGYHQIEHLRRQGVTEVNIITNNLSLAGSDADSSNTELINSSEQLIQFQTRIKQVHAVRKKTIDAVRAMMIATRAGCLYSPKSMIEPLNDLMSQIIDNQDVAIGVLQIKDMNEQIYAHSVNVSMMMMGLANILGYSKESIYEAGTAGILHDIGMTRFPEDVVRREGLQTRMELDSLKKHPVYGVEIVRTFKKKLPDSVINTIAEHHEKLNGSGYPRFLKGTQIKQMSMMCALADVYDRLTTNGFTHRACLPQEALALIFQGADEEYPRNLVEMFTKLLGIFPVGSFVKLESGEMGLVVSINRENLLFPQLVMLFDKGGKRIDKMYIRDLSKCRKESDRELWKISCSLDPASFGINPSEILFK